MTKKSVPPSERLYGAMEMLVVSVGVLAVLTIAAFSVQVGYLSGVLGTNSVSVTVVNQAPALGVIVGERAGINCGNTCVRNYNSGDTIRLEAQSEIGYTVGDWGISTTTQQLECQNEVGNYCVIDIPTDPVTITVDWRPSQYSLTVAKTGNGNGVINGPGVNCGDDCQAVWTAGESLTISATPDAGSRFVGWQPLATDCALTDSITGSAIVNTAQLCQLAGETQQPSRTAVARFDLVEQPAENPTPTPTGTTSDEADDQVVLVPPTVNPIVLRDSAGNIVEWSVDNPAQFESGQPIRLESTTDPDTLVRLYIFSELHEVVVTADQTGAWSYTIANLEPGDHRVEMELENTETGATTDRLDALRFSIANNVTEEFVTETAPEQAKEPIGWLAAVLQFGVPIVVVIGLVVLYQRITKARPLK